MAVRRMASFAEFKEFTREVARGKRKVDLREPKIWCERIDRTAPTRAVRFPSLEAGAKLLSAKNCALLRTIAERNPRSVAELASITGRAEQNLLRTLKKLEAAGIVRFEKGEGRARRPIVAARKVHFEIDLVAR